MPSVPFYLLLPIDWQFVISSRFNSPRSYPFAPQRLQLHEGIDFAPKYPGNVPLPVRASQRGIVDKIGFDARGYGNYVRVVHTWGNERFVTWYGHLAEARVKVNDYLSAGQMLGIAGSTGNSTGTHVHLTLQHIGKGLKNYVVDDVIDPEPFLSAELIPFDEAWWVADVTTPDGTDVKQGQSFRRTWRIRNAGTSLWATGYQLAFFNDVNMSKVSAVALPAARPGDEVEVSVDMIAPNRFGTQRSTWKPRNPSNQWFDYAMYAEVDVQPSQNETIHEARYIDDVTIPYDTPMKPGQTFRKTWRLLNNGKAPWTSAFKLTFISDDQMGGPNSVPMPPTLPGKETDVSVDLVAPMQPGKVRGTWQVTDPQGNPINYPIRVEIVVIPSVPLIDNAAFAADVTVLQPGQTFVKTWRIMNVGQTRWADGYTFVWLDGERMNAPDSIIVPETKPGVYAEISVTLTAPSEPGTYSSQWEIRSPDGQGFGPVFDAYVEVRG